ncbi:hypothetical protein COMNV_01143 [Commensalibacter sp. Nvir]|uniref:hypothetical protein n=1 Tax=Commensalibacter sp. Nvir TaxID=3069817 RepID=UPI002D687ADE|nr:hypothetical protein COMNV_01143 [Commensalibacter sp. Nvir]
MSTSRENTCFFSQTQSNHEQNYAKNFDVDAVKKALENIGSSSSKKNDALKNRLKLKESSQRRRFVQDGDVIVEKLPSNRFTKRVKSQNEDYSLANKHEKELYRSSDPLPTSSEIITLLADLSDKQDKLEKITLTNARMFEQLIKQNTELLQQIQILREQFPLNKKKVADSSEKLSAKLNYACSVKPEPVKWWIKK